MKNSIGETVLHFSRNIDVIKYLIEVHHADPTVISDEGQTVLHSNCNKEKMEYLIDKGIDVNAEDNDKNTILTSETCFGQLLKT